MMLSGTLHTQSPEVMMLVMLLVMLAVMLAIGRQCGVCAVRCRDCGGLRWRELRILPRLSIPHRKEVEEVE